MTADHLVSPLRVGCVSGAYGIRGWVRIRSWTDPVSNIFEYQPWFLATEDGWRPVTVTQWRRQGQGFVAQLEGCGDRTQAEKRYVGREIAVPSVVLPALPDGEYYWKDLIGLRVRLPGGQDLGQVSGMLETGANDVLVVTGDSASLDTRERLVPWLLDDVIVQVVPGEGYLIADWDPDF